MNTGFFRLSFSLMRNFALLFSLSAMTIVAPTASADDFNDALDAYNKGQFARATDIWRDLAEQDNIEAQYALGVMYFKGEGIDQNRELAVAWFQKAAGQGHLASMFNMGVSLWTGEGASVDYEDALQWWQRAAEEGYAPAQYNLGITYYSGDSVGTDLTLARYWLEQASTQNYSDSASLLARINGTQQSDSETAQLDRQIEGQLDARVADSTPVISDPGSNDDLLDSLDSEKLSATENTTENTIDSATDDSVIDVVSVDEEDVSSVASILTEEAQPDDIQTENPIGSIPGIVSVAYDDANNPANDNAGKTSRELLKEQAIAELAASDTDIQTNTHTDAQAAADVAIAEATASEDGNVSQVEIVDDQSADESPSTLALAESDEALPPLAAPVDVPGPLEQTTLIDTIRIGNQPAPVYASNNRQAPVIETLAPGTPVRVIEKKGSFSRIEAPGGFPVWVYGRYVRVDGIWAYITGDRVNARSLPSTARTAVSLGLLSKDIRVAFLEARPGWIHVRAPETFSAWIETGSITYQNEPEDGFELAWNSARQGVIGE